MVVFGDAANGSTACFGILKSEGEKHGLTIATFNPLSCFSSAEDLSEIRSSAGLSILSIWREDDAVHLTAAAFNDIVAVLSNQAKNNGKQPLTGQVRPRLASVIPAVMQATPPVREPAWISGELSAARGSPPGGQCGGYQGGQWGGRGRSPWLGPCHFPY